MGGKSRPERLKRHGIGQVCGETHGSAKLTEEKVALCRFLVRKKRATCAALARRYNVCQATMWYAVHGVTWRHLGESFAPPSGPYRGSQKKSRIQWA
jgi:hypothetical protein